MRSASTSKGLVTKSMAPSFIASTAGGIARVADTTTTGGPSPRSASSRSMSRPLRPGITRSSRITSAPPRSSASNASSTLLAVATSCSSLSSRRSDSCTPRSSSTTSTRPMAAQSTPPDARQSGCGQLDQDQRLAGVAGLDRERAAVCAHHRLDRRHRERVLGQPQPEIGLCAGAARAQQDAQPTAAGGARVVRRAPARGDVEVALLGQPGDRLLEQQPEREAQLLGVAERERLLAIELLEHDEATFVDARSLELEQAREQPR